jgi:cobalamin biosynthesis Mg chelatase CobN
VLLLAAWALLAAGVTLVRKLLGSAFVGRAERRKARKPTLTTPIEETLSKGQSVADKRRNRGPWVVLLLAASALLAVGAVLWGLNNAERRLTAAAEEALAAVGLPVTVEVSGRDAILSGEVNAADQARAIELVRDISGIREVEWESLPTASATTTTTGTVETTVTSTVTSVDTSRPPTTSTTQATGSTTTDVSVLPSSEGGDAGAPPQLPRTGSEFTVALFGIVALLAGTLLVRRTRGWESRGRRTSERLATLKGLTAVDGSEIEPRPAQDPPKHK